MTNKLKLHSNLPWKDVRPGDYAISIVNKKNKKNQQYLTEKRPYKILERSSHFFEIQCDLGNYLHYCIPFQCAYQKGGNWIFQRVE